MLGLISVLSLFKFADRIQIWKVMAFSCAFVITAFLMVMSQILVGKGGLVYAIGSIALGLQAMTFFLSNFLLSRIVNKETRGTMYSLNGFIDGLGVALANGLGGYLFDEVANIAPYMLAISFYLIFWVFTLYFGFKGKVD